MPAEIEQAIKLLRLNLNGLLKKRILLATLGFVVLFDILIGSYVIHLSLLIYQRVLSLVNLSITMFFRTVFIVMLYSVYSFSITMLAIELPLDSLSKELENGAAEILTFYTSRTVYFISKLLALFIFTWLFLLVHLTSLYLVFMSYTNISYWTILKLSAILLYQLSIILSISIFLDTVFSRVKLIPSLLGVLTAIAGGYVGLMLLANLAPKLLESRIMSELLSRGPPGLAQVYDILYKASYLAPLLERLSLVPRLLYPLVNYLYLSLLATCYYILGQGHWPCFLMPRATLLDQVFPGLWDLLLIGSAYLYFKYKDL